ncbi:MAG: S9 family peptidase [Dysgonamonadaceae bacterium]|jgi:dipeptidyl aminopeptidase/acylaminoacyl peptidase|nr:S9 family peptidase [Dysgonamonadaceae bacterium]
MNSTNFFNLHTLSGKKLLTIVMVVFMASVSVSVSAQELRELYKKTDGFQAKYDSLYHNKILSGNSIKGTDNFWFLMRTKKGNEFYLIQADKGKCFPAFNQESLASMLKTSQGKDSIKAYDLPFRNIEFNKTMDTILFSIDNEKYVCSLTDYKISKGEREEPRRRGNEYWGRFNRSNDREKVLSPDKKKEAYISEGNLWITDIETGKSKKLSNDGALTDYYSSEIHWSPDSKKIVCCRFRPGGDRKLLMVVSSPKDRLQPATETYDYAKPGDALPIRRPVLFHIEEEKSLQFDFPNIEQQYDLNRIRWNESSTAFTFHFNRRGHQQYTIYEGDVGGNLKTLVDERSNTFIYYNMIYDFPLKDAGERLWISERDGWRHLYLYDANGNVKKQITKGEWVVKTVVHADEKNREVIIKACGRDKDEDPYLEKYYRVKIDKGNITALTPENANHNVIFNDDFTYMTDIYSRVDMSPVFVVRSAIDGKIVYKPEQQPDITKMVAAGWRTPEVFKAKGRDGKTDIWGIIMRPSDYDPNKKYPVIEYIYAGPHDSHVPKSFAVAHRPNELAELGFIIVLIDGMGTANRSKAFHDVCWKNLKDAGFPDRIAWIKAAAAQYPQMDIERVGIYGGSAGGQNAMGALLFHPDFYKVAVAACGCHDNRMDKLWWNEQWMGYPIGKEYEECSNVVNAHLLKGKLMLILGELDNNVDPSSTLQVVNELIKHNKDFEFVMLPNVRHTLGESYGERKRRDFFVNHLMGLPSLEWNIK